MTDHRGRQKGPQNHAEGQHGPRTEHKLVEELHGKHGGSPESEGAPQRQEPEAAEPREGKHRLAEDRQQHDEAELASEYNRTVERKERDGQSIDGPSTKGGKAPGHEH